MNKISQKTSLEWKNLCEELKNCVESFSDIIFANPKVLKQIFRFSSINPTSVSSGKVYNN